MDRSASSSETRRNSTGNISRAPLSLWDVQYGDIMSTTRIGTKEWKEILDTVHQYHVVYRLLWVNRVMEQLRQEFKSRDDVMNLLELLLGFEDRTWKNSEEELQYVLTMDTFSSFCKRPDCEIWPHLVRQGRSMDLLKDVLRFHLVNALPTIYLVDKERGLFLLVGSQHTPEIQAVFQRLTVAWNVHSRLANPERAALHLADLPAHHIAQTTMDLAFGPIYTSGAALSVFEGIISPTTGLGVALLPAPIEEYLQLLWHKRVHYSNVIHERQAVSQNVLKLGLPWMECSRCSQAKEVGMVFGLRDTEANARFVRILGLGMQHILSRIDFFHRAVHVRKVIIDLHLTLEHNPMVCCRTRQVRGARGV